jgi:hypothetical protein
MSREEAFDRFLAEARRVDIKSAVAVAKRAILSGPITKHQYSTLCGNQLVEEQFLAKNIFAIDSENLCGFDSKVTENAVRHRWRTLEDRAARQWFL